METNKKPSPQEMFKKTIEDTAAKAIQSRLSGKAGQEACARVAMAFKSIASKNRDVYGCTMASVSNCVVLAAMCGLFPSGISQEADADLFVQKGREKVNGKWQDKPFGTWTLEYRPNARGLRKYVKRMAGIDIVPMCVLHGENFEWKEGLVRTMNHSPDPEIEDVTEENLVVGYTTWTFPDGTKDFTVIRKGDIHRARAASEAYKRYLKNQVAGEQWNPEPPWVTAYHPQVLKTLILWTIRRCIVFNADQDTIMGDVADAAEDTEDREIIDVVESVPEVVEEVKEEPKEAKSTAATLNAFLEQKVVPESHRIEAPVEEPAMPWEEPAKKPDVVEVAGVRTVTAAKTEAKPVELPDPKDLKEAKRVAAMLENGIPTERIKAIRAGLNINPDIAVGTSRIGIDKANEYIAALKAEKTGIAHEPEKPQAQVAQTLFPPVSDEHGAEDGVAPF